MWKIPLYRPREITIPQQSHLLIQIRFGFEAQKTLEIIAPKIAENSQTRLRIILWNAQHFSLLTS